MTRVVTIILIMLVFLFTLSLDAGATGDIKKFEQEVKGILDVVSPSIVKVVAENHKMYVATGIAVERSHVVSSMKVIQNQYADIYIKTAAGDTYPARVVGKDRESSLILLKTEKGSLTPIKWAESSGVGDWIAVVGVFYKRFPSIYQGMVSSVSDEEVILNAPVAPGSAGGAVVNKKGELVGMVRGRFGFAFSPDYTYKDHSGEIHIQSFRNRNENLCYAVPAQKVKGIAEDLKKYGKVRRGWLGVLLTGGEKGVKIKYVTDKSPAGRAGIRKDDEILKIDGKPVRDPAAISKAVKILKPGQKVKMELLRGNKRKSLLVVIGEAKPKRALWASVEFPGQYDEIREFPEFRESLPKLENYIFRVGGSRTLGIDVMPLTPQLARELSVKEGAGLMISRVLENSAAEKAGFRAADIIVKVADKKIETNADLRNVINDLEDDRSLDIHVYREGKLKKITVIPDKDSRLNIWFDRFRDKMMDIKTGVDRREGLERTKQNLPELYKKQLEQLESGKRTELEKYKETLKKMQQEQEKLKKEMEKLKKRLEKKEKGDSKK